MPKLRWLVVGLSSWRTGFNARPLYVGFVVDEVALGKVLPRVLSFSTVSIIPPVLSIHSSIAGAVYT